MVLPYQQVCTNNQIQIQHWEDGTAPTQPKPGERFSCRFNFTVTFFISVSVKQYSASFSFSFDRFQYKTAENDKHASIRPCHFVCGGQQQQLCLQTDNSTTCGHTSLERYSKWVQNPRWTVMTHAFTLPSNQSLQFVHLPVRWLICGTY